jgi:hypothetical protein
MDGIDWAARLADTLAARERSRTAERELRDEIGRRRVRWLAHRHRQKLSGPHSRAGRAGHTGNEGT